MKNDRFLQNKLSSKEFSWGMRYLLFQAVFLPGLLGLLPVSDTELNLTFYCINFCCVLWILRRFLLQSIPSGWQQILRVVCIGIAFFLLYQASQFCLTAAFRLFGFSFTNKNDLFVIQMAREHYLLLFIGTVILVPVTEEALHRGVVFRGMYERSPMAAWLVSTVLFSLIHIMSYIGTCDFPTLALSFLQYIPAGLCLAGAYRLSGSLLCPVLIHMAVNATAMLSLR